MQNQSLDYLAHYGKLGMHWGKRNTRSKLGSFQQVSKVEKNTQKEHMKTTAVKAVKIGGAIAAGIIASNVGSSLILNHTGNESAARLGGIALGTIAAINYADLVFSKPKNRH